MYRKFEFTTVSGDHGTVFARRIEFTNAHVAFYDPDGELIVAIYAGDIAHVRPERNEAGRIIIYSQAEALRLAQTDQTDQQ